MAEVAHQLVSLSETKTVLRVDGSAVDTELTQLILDVTLAIEAVCERQIVARSGDSDADEYHDLAAPQGFLYTRLRPVRSVTRVQLNGSDLDPSDYVLDTSTGLLSLVGAGIAPVRGPLLGAPYDRFRGAFPEDDWRFSAKYFPAKLAGGRVVYKGGYATRADVDGDIRLIAFDAIARKWRERERKSQGATTEIAQGFNVVTQYDPKLLTQEMADRLRRWKTFSRTAR